MIISPWGEILACLEQGQGIVTAELSMKELSKVRKAMPVAAHNQFITKLKSYE
jgi:nitrilase